VLLEAKMVQSFNRSTLGKLLSQICGESTSIHTSTIYAALFDTNEYGKSALPVEVTA
jgi:hypothetical protein